MGVYWMTARTRALLGAVVLALTLPVAAAAVSAPPAAASVSAPRLSTATLGDRVLNKAETRAGVWYSYGAAGPFNFDCSGLVFWSAGQLGITLPRTTYGMLAGTTHLYRIPLSSVRRGDLIFFGSGHVEFATIWYHVSFGAHHSGTTVGWRAYDPRYYGPTMAMRFR